SLCSHLFHIQHPAVIYIYTLSLHDALPIFKFKGNPETFSSNWRRSDWIGIRSSLQTFGFRSFSGGIYGQNHPNHGFRTKQGIDEDRKSTRLNSSHVKISYAVFCLKKKREKR